MLGWALLGLAFVLFIWLEGASFGVLVWGMMLALAIFVTAIILAYLPVVLRPIAALLSQP